MEKNGIWEEHWKVAAFMVNEQQRIRLRSVGDIFQELANNHANFRKVGFEDMKAIGKFWVLNRQSIQFNQWPNWEQNIRVESWISMMKGPFSLRHFAVFDTSGNIMIRASYLWTCIDQKKMKPSAIPEGDFPIIDNRDFELPTPHKFKIDGVEKKSMDHIVRDSDLDIIGHTNNATYLQWAADIIADQSIGVNQLDANYTGESHVGQKMCIKLFQHGASHWFVGVLNHENQNIFKLKFS